VRNIWLLCLWLLCAVAPAFAYDPTGKYTYAERGSSGEMVVSFGEIPHDPNQLGTLYLRNWGPKPLYVRINTVELEQFNTCALEADEPLAGRVSSGDDYLAAVSSKQYPGDSPSADATFDIVFTPGKAVVTVKADGGYCGMRGWFGGQWTKGLPKKKHR
jgi:hypothetical protein